MGTTTRIYATVALASALAACGAGPRDAGSDALDAPADVLSARVTLEIGEAEGEEAYLFGRVFGLALDPDGRIYVADGQANEVRVFAPDGAHLFTFGRTGGGPGEMRRPCCLAFDRAGLLWVRDAGNARYNAYRVDAGGATYIRQIRMAHGDVNFGPPITFTADGHLIDIGHRYDPTGDAATLYRFHLDSAGAVVREEAIPIPTPQELGAHIIERTSGNRGNGSTSGRRTARATSSRTRPTEAAPRPSAPPTRSSGTGLTANWRTPSGGRT